jgi:hypothetical protein
VPGTLHEQPPPPVAIKRLGSTTGVLVEPELDPGFEAWLRHSPSRQTWPEGQRTFQHG